jgi:hypothetical protein
VESYLEGHGDLAAALLGAEAEVTDDTGAESWSLEEVVPERGLAVVALIEHLWTGPLAAALDSAGARLLEETWLSQEDRELLASLEA